jgi:hypothetical protein
MYVAHADDTTVCVVAIRALTVTVYVFASVIFIAWANKISGTVGFGRVKRFGVTLAGE